MSTIGREISNKIKGGGYITKNTTIDEKNRLLPTPNVSRQPDGTVSYTKREIGDHRIGINWYGTTDVSNVTTSKMLEYIHNDARNLLCMYYTFVDTVTFEGKKFYLWEYDENTDPNQTVDGPYPYFLTDTLEFLAEDMIGDDGAEIMNPLRPLFANNDLGVYDKRVSGANWHVGQKLSITTDTPVSSFTPILIVID